MITNNNPHLLDKYTKNSPCVIFFHMDGCHHCEGVKKIWPSFKRQMCNKHNNKIKFLNVNANALPFIDNNKFNIRGFPSIVKSTPKSGHIEEFNEPERSKERLIKWFESKFNRELKPKRFSMKKKLPIVKKKDTVRLNSKPKKKKAPPKKKKASPKKKKAKGNKKTEKKPNFSREDSIYESPRSSLFS